MVVSNHPIGCNCARCANGGTEMKKKIKKIVLVATMAASVAGSPVFAGGDPIASTNAKVVAMQNDVIAKAGDPLVGKMLAVLLTWPAILIIGTGEVLTGGANQ